MSEKKVTKKLTKKHVLFKASSDEGDEVPKCATKSKESIVKHKKQVQKKQRERIICTCGKEIQRYYLKKHLQLNIHKNYLKLIECRCGEEIKIGQLLPYDWQKPNNCHKRITK